MQNIISLMIAFTSISPLLAAEPPVQEPSTHPFLADFHSDDAVPAALLETYVQFAELAIAGEDLRPLILPHAVQITTQPRERSREYGSDMNRPFLMDGFRPHIVLIRRDGEDSWLIRTSTSYIFFVETKSGRWRIYGYGDKPIL